MSLLAKNFRAAVLKEKDPRMINEARCDVGYSMGFPTLDWTNGQIIHVKSEAKGLDEYYYSIGISEGCMATFIGASMSGKSTLLAQIAANIVRPFKTSCIFEDSMEGGLSWSRREAFSGFHDAELKERYIVRNKGVNAENFYKRIKMIQDMKLSDPAHFEYDTGLLDNFGNPIKAYEPTVYVLDSIAMIMPDKYTEEDEIAGNMSASASARVITQIIRTIIPMLKAANIILLIVNHILDDIQIGMTRKKPDLPFLKVGERLPKGKSVIFLSNNIIRLDPSTKLKEDEKYKVAGYLVDVTFIKSRSNRPNVKTTMVLDLDKGFDPILSLYLFLQEKERISGAGIGMYIDDHKEAKFSMGNLRNKIDKNSDGFRQDVYDSFMKACQEELCKLPRMASSELEEQRGCTNELTQMCLAAIPKPEEIKYVEDEV